MHGASASVSSSARLTSKKRRKSVVSSKQLVDLEELVEEEKEQKNWKGIIIAVLVIILVSSCVVVAVIIVTPEEVIERKGDKLSFEELVNGAYQPYAVKPIWSKDGRSLLYKNQDDELVIFECDSNYSSMFLDNSPYRESLASDFLISPDRSFILFIHSRKKIYDHFSVSEYRLYDTDTRISRDLIGPHGHLFQYVTWTHSGQSLIVVQNNNIYFKESVSEQRSGEPFLPVSSSGKVGDIFNGVPDWLYGEEVLRRDNTVWLSSNDQFLVYMEINDTGIPLIEMVHFSDPLNSYSERHTLRYPKPGSPLPVTKLKVYNFPKNQTFVVSTPKLFLNRSPYVTSLVWKDNVTFAVTWLSVHHNVSIISICSAPSGLCYNNILLQSRIGWIDPPIDIIFTPSGNEYFITTPRYDGTGNTYKQVAIVDATVEINPPNQNGQMMFLTVNIVEVHKIVSFSNDTVYFLASPIEKPEERHLYSVTTNMHAYDFRDMTCLTCNVSDECRYVDVSFGLAGQYYLLACLGPDVPFYSVVEAPDILVATIEDNERLRQHLATKLLPDYEYMNITLPEENYVLAKTILPPVLDMKEEIRYNVLIVPNNEIGDQSFTAKFYIGWEEVLSSLRSIVIAKIDTSGSSGRGEEWLKSIRGQIGARESDEILASMRFFRSLHYVTEKMGISGQSYGGYVALATLNSDFNDVIFCGTALSPVVDYSYMNSYVNMKYNIPAGNHISQGQKLLRSAANMEKHSLFILHGTLNDRVQFQHTAQYIKSLVDAGVSHMQQIYPDVRNILDTHLSHVVNSIEHFYIDCFGLDPNSDPVYIVEDEEEE